MAIPLAAVGALLPAAGGLLGGNLTTPPKTIFGKLLGGITGRTANAAAIASGSVPASPVQTIPLQSNTGGLSGSISFGQDQRLNFQPFAILLAIVAVVYFIFQPKKRRR